LKSRKATEIGPIKEGETASVSQSIRLPREGTYRVEFVLSDGNKTKSTAEIYLSGLERLKTDVQEIGIGIDSIDFLVRKVVGNNVVIESDVYLTNSGSNVSQDYKMLVKAREMDARLIADKVWTTTGLIGPEETVVRSVNLTVPDNYNYVVEVLVWKDNVLVKRGEDYVQLNPQKVIDKNMTVESKDIVTSDFVVEEPVMPGETPAYETPYEEPEMGTPGFGSVLAIISLIAALFIFRRRSV
jgi:PGF-CTERM protein